MPFDNLDAEAIFTNSNELISHLTNLAVNKNNVFRGYGKRSELLPNIIREKDWSDQEINLLHEFERYGLQYFSPNSPIDFMSYAQHYGLPTRLLDFTCNPFTALYFALFMPKSTRYTYDEDMIYYYIRYCNLNEQIHIRTLPYFDDNLFLSSSFTTQSSRMIFLLRRIIRGLEEKVDDNKTGIKVIAEYFERIYCEDHPENTDVDASAFKKYIDEEITKFEKRKILFMDANQCSQRIVMQQGLFMFPYTLTKSEHIEIVQNNTRIIKIHKDIRDELLEYLNTIGINAFRLMPDLQNVCYAIKRKITEERQAKSPLFKRQMPLEENDINEIHILLKRAFDRYKEEDGFANIAPVGNFIKKAKPNFDPRTYGFSKLFDLISNFPDKYEIKKDEGNGTVPIAVYKCT